MFNVGDKVVYPMHGAGTIDSIDKKNILDEEVEYINISMPGGVKVMVPSNQASKQGLRNIISQNDVEKVFCVLETDETAMSDNWNKRYRDNMDKMKSGDIYEVEDVVRNLSFKQKEKGLILANSVGIVDADYYGNPDNDGLIMYAFYNFFAEDVQIKKGDVIGQAIFKKYEIIDSDNASGERVGGFGSTSK